MITRKLQVFVSSTYKDLLSERQAAVEGILTAKHIPAGMELFTAEDKTQLEVIKRWIDESDVYMLILGGRYGSIDPETKLSYTELEYQYALKKKKPHFALVLTDEAIRVRAESGTVGLPDVANAEKLAAFRALVTSNKEVKMCSDIKDITIGVLGSMAALADRDDLHGWVSGAIAEDNNRLTAENTKLRAENEKLHAKVEAAGIRAKAKAEYPNGMTFDDICAILQRDTYSIENEDGTVQDNLNALGLLMRYERSLNLGIDDAHGMSAVEKFLFYALAPILASPGLVETLKLQNRIQRIQTSEVGKRFITEWKQKNPKFVPKPVKYSLKK